MNLQGERSLSSCRVYVFCYADGFGLSPHQFSLPLEWRANPTRIKNRKLREQIQSAHQSKRCNSPVITGEIYIFLFLGTIGIFEKSPTRFDPPVYFLVLTADHVPFNAAFAGIGINRSSSLPGKFSIRLTIKKPLPAVKSNSCYLCSEEKSFDFIPG